MEHTGHGIGSLLFLTESTAAHCLFVWRQKPLIVKSALEADRRSWGVRRSYTFQSDLENLEQFQTTETGVLTPAMLNLVQFSPYSLIVITGCLAANLQWRPPRKQWHFLETAASTPSETGQLCNGTVGTGLHYLSSVWPLCFAGCGTCSWVAQPPGVSFLTYRVEIELSWKRTADSVFRLVRLRMDLWLGNVSCSSCKFWKGYISTRHITKCASLVQSGKEITLGKPQTLFQVIFSKMFSVLIF